MKILLGFLSILAIYVIGYGIFIYNGIEKFNNSMFKTKEVATCFKNEYIKNEGGLVLFIIKTGLLGLNIDFTNPNALERTIKTCVKNKNDVRDFDVIMQKLLGVE